MTNIKLFYELFTNAATNSYFLLVGYGTILIPKKSLVWLEDSAIFV